MLEESGDMLEESGDMLEESKDTNGFSEHELLDIMYNACNSHKTGDWHNIISSKPD